jgi:hypothetical protein
MNPVAIGLLVVLIVGIAGYLLKGGIVSADTSSGPQAAGGASAAFIQALANAIAQAEGANPTINNPGDLTGGDVPNTQITGTFNAAGVVSIDTLDHGWQALYTKLENIYSGKSTVYWPGMTVSQFGAVYTGGDNAEAWAATVAGAFGADPDANTLADLAANYG